MKRNWTLAMILVACSQCAWAIYGPDLTRADASVALRACQEANFEQGREIAKAMQSGDPDDVLRVLGRALKQWRATPVGSPVYAARAFCIHELVPARLQPGGSDAASRLEPTMAVKRFGELGIEYFWYGPDGEFTLKDDPVNLEKLALDHLDSTWGRQAFLMMTRLGWSWGACQEGADQFRVVIKHGESFLSQYPDSEVSDSIRLELANAYATWWNVSNLEPNESTKPESYKAGASKAKQRAVRLYQEYLRAPNAANQKEAQKRLAALERNPKGSETYDYFCDDYED